MFYRFNAHKEGRGRARQSKDSEVALDETARRIASAILKVQRRWADLMRQWAEKLLGKWLRILTVVSFAAAAIFFLSLIILPLAAHRMFQPEWLPVVSWRKAPGQHASGASGDSLKKKLPVGSHQAGEHQKQK
ncbi:hypothetical protein [Dyadobacter sp. MSC1_007]|jgi:hypothetical protein|uniref:hypothetical protein n=1 Tax=Dyadobacter sp. MSC1_007 TaxID=2909264 RepID=UPI00202DD421|nr:hypothetical protein [Dyadobacter sp. MSC1_007]